jgi:hypothetical protein
MSKEKELEALQRATRSSGVDEIARISQLTGASEYEGLRRGALETNVIAAKRRFREAGQAGKQLLTMGFEAVGAIPEGATAAYTEDIRREAEEFAKTPYAQGGTAGQILADITMSLPALVVAGPAITTVRGAMALGAIEGLSRPAYSQEDLNLLNPERVKNVAVSTLAAGGGTYLINRLVPSASLAIHEKMSAAPFSLAKKKSLEGIQREAAQESVDSAKKFNTFVTPAEATKDQLAFNREAGISLFGKKGRQLYNRIIKREEQLQGSINDIVNGLTPEGRTAANNTAAQYSDNAYRTEFPLMQELVNDNKIFKQAYLAVSESNARQQFIRQSGGRVSIQPNTVGELHLMRLHIDDLIKSAKSQKAPIAGLSEARNLLLGVADTFAPEYALARNIRQRTILQDKLFDALQKSKDKDIKTSNFYKAFLESGEKRNNLFKEIDNIIDKPVSESVRKNIEAITPVLKAVNDSPLNKALGIREVQLRAAGVGGVRGVILNLSTNITDGILDRYVVDFITSPSWIEEFAKRAANKTQATQNRIMMETFYNYIGRVSPTIASSLQFTGETEKLLAQ